MAAKTIVWYCAIMPIYANKRENNGVGLKYFCVIKKEAYPIVRLLEK